MNSPLDRLARLIIERSSLKADYPKYKLTSGQMSAFYFDCKRTTFHAPAMHLIGSVFWERIQAAGQAPQAVGGLTQGADPIAFATAIAAQSEGEELDVFSVRKQPKIHGSCTLIENRPDLEGARVVVVDDVVTSGGSVVQAIDGCRKEGFQVVQVVVLIDRETGGMNHIETCLGTGDPVSAIFTKSDLDEVERQLERG